MFSNNLVQRIRREYGNKGHICYRLFCITFQKAYRSLSGEAILQDLETVVTFTIPAVKRCLPRWSLRASW